MAVETLSAPERAIRRTGPLRSPLALGAAVYVAVRLATLVVVLLVDLSTHRGLVHELSRWDGKWFLRAAIHGWPAPMPRVDGHLTGSTIAFFPLFPLLLRALHAVTGLSDAVVGLWVSAVTGLAATMGVGALTRSYADDDSARRATLLVALSPGAFVFSLIYNEGFVIGLAAIGLWALIRERWWLAAVAGAVGTAMSPVGLVFLVPAAWVAIVQLRQRQYGALVVPVATPLGAAAWLGYLWAHDGTPRAWSLTERAGWHSYASLAYPFRIIGKFVTNPVSPTMTGQLLVIGTVVTVAGLVVVWKERPPAPIAIYAFAAAAVFVVAEPVGLRPRFVMLVFPIAMAVATRYRGRVFAAIATASALGLVLMTIEELHSWAIFP
ncbi:MAG TPA: mannosyltransferase family protein [Acidimicrobiales bacterium]|nr:mannosyltransferase family protein [Acidimicrobiales bacterium]